MRAKKANSKMFIIKNGQGFVKEITDQGQLLLTQDPKEARVFQDPMRIFWQEGDPNYTPLPVAETKKARR